jgi:hypothetical protein
MQPNEKPFEGYKNGEEMWRDNVLSHGIDEAIIITRNYLDMNLKRKHSLDERQFCNELFAGFFFATTGRLDPRKLVYPYDYKTAHERTEFSYYHASRETNTACTRGIDSIIRDSQYETDFYNLEIAAMKAVLDYGFPRICAVLAFNYKDKARDARFSPENRRWVAGFSKHENSFCDTWLQSHATLIDAFCCYVRKLYQDFDAERFALPGQEESGEFNSGVEIKRAITTFDDGKGFSTGYAIGHNPNAVEWVCWQFAVRDGVRHFNWGVYGSEEQTAMDSYIARIFVALSK